MREDMEVVRKALRGQISLTKLTCEDQQVIPLGQGESGRKDITETPLRPQDIEEAEWMEEFINMPRRRCVVMKVNVTF